MRRHEPLDIDAAVIRLAGQVDRLQHDVAALTPLRDDVDAHGRGLRDLADLVRRTGTAASSAAESDDEPPPAEWLTVIDPAEAVVLLAVLDQWTRDVWLHFHPLVRCWPWHPGVVAELLTCHQLWAEALAAGMGPGALGAWHDRWRPGAAQRIQRVLMGCERTDGAHVTGPSTRWTVDVAALDELAAWWATTHGASGSTPPGLTRESLR